MAWRTEEEAPRSVLDLVKAEEQDVTIGLSSSPLEDGIKALTLDVEGLSAQHEGRKNAEPNSGHSIYHAGSSKLEIKQPVGRRLLLPWGVCVVEIVGSSAGERKEARVSGQSCLLYFLLFKILEVGSKPLSCWLHDPAPGKQSQDVVSPWHSAEIQKLLHGGQLSSMGGLRTGPVSLCLLPRGLETHQK